MENLFIENHSCREARGIRIRFIRDNLLALTREKFCEHTDITLQSLKGWELGWGGGLTVKGAEKIVKRAKELNVSCTCSWLMHEIGREAVCFTNDLDINNHLDEHIAKELLLFKEQHNAIVSIVSDDAMAPMLCAGNYVGGIAVNNIEVAVGKECILTDDNGKIYIRILKKGDEPGLYNLCSLNSNLILANDAIKNVSVQIAAPIVFIRK